jgi:hypothetical protein
MEIPKQRIGEATHLLDHIAKEANGAVELLEETADTGIVRSAVLEVRRIASELEGFVSEIVAKGGG